MKLNEKVSLYSILVNMTLLILKGSAAFLSGSISALAETIHSTIDLLASIIVFIGLKISKIKSKQFPYGLYKVENLVSILVATFILYAGFEIVKKVIFGESSLIKNFYPVLAIYVIVLIITYAFSKYELSMAKKIGSPSLIADAKHIRMDMFSVSVVMIGIAGEFIGFRIDKIAASVIVIFIVKTSIEILVNALKVLLDGSLENEKIENIREIILAVPSVKDVRELRGRNSGNHIFVEANIGIDLMSFNEAHKTTEKIENAIRKEYPNAELIRLHYEPAATDEITGKIRLLAPKKEFPGEIPERRGAKETVDGVTVRIRSNRGKRRGRNLAVARCRWNNGIQENRPLLLM